MIKTFYCILSFLIFSTYSHGQLGSPGLDALLLHSDIIVQGTIRYKYCPPGHSINTLMSDNCTVALEITEVILGTPRLSKLEIQEQSTADTVTIDGKIKVMSFAHRRAKFENATKSIQSPESTFYMDYNIELGDDVIVFLKGDYVVEKRHNHIKGWMIYPLADQYLGVITANDFVTDYLRNKIKLSAEKQK